MNCWEIIGIPPTVDKRTIKRAYATKLKTHRPDEDPEAFKVLRAAFEEAIEEAKYYQPNGEATERHTNSTETSSNNSKSNQANRQPSTTNIDCNTENTEEFIKYIQTATVEIYENFNERIQISSWRDIYESESSWSLEVKQHMALWLFSFIGRNRFIPKEIIEYLENIFLWQENYNWLKRTFAEDFVRYVLNRIITSQWSLSYKGINFPESIDFQGIETYFAQREHLEYLTISKESKNRDELLQAIIDKNIQDPELYRLLSSLYFDNQELTPALEYSRILAKEYTNELEGHLTKAAIYYKKKNFSEALASYESTLSIDEDHDIALKGLAACYLELNDLHSAKCLYEQVSIQSPFDLEARIQLVRINQLLIKENLRVLSDSPEDTKAQLQTAESYFEIGAYSEAIQFILSIIEKNAPATEYIGDLHHLLGLSYEAIYKISDAQPHFIKALEISEENGENGYYSLIKLGELYIKQDQHDKALGLLTKALRYNPDSAKALELLANAQRCLNLNDEALQNINRSIGKSGIATLFAHCY
ncbi:J domain-containing protein [Microbulbifer variabilis]|uniref:J domain-containing protein n=1 Tax=Microbulbifer variabilis TaxID=266805 RepID=UPI001CFEC62A|nr:J domain-containing protein [Microbulbifer variabilis]